VWPSTCAASGAGASKSPMSGSGWVDGLTPGFSGAAPRGADSRGACRARPCRALRSPHRRPAAGPEAARDPRHRERRHEQRRAEPEQVAPARGVRLVPHLGIGERGAHAQPVARVRRHASPHQRDGQRHQEHAHRREGQGREEGWHSTGTRVCVRPAHAQVQVCRLPNHPEAQPRRVRSRSSAATPR
jgi:hypothetical protein